MIDYVANYIISLGKWVALVNSPTRYSILPYLGAFLLLRSSLSQLLAFLTLS